MMNEIADIMLKEFGCDNYSCPRGWEEKLLRPVIAALRTDVRDGLSPRVLQVKEKFGQLRVYVVGASPATQTAVDSMEDASGHTCEVCGDEAARGTEGRGWIRTLCEPHRITRALRRGSE